MQSDVRVQTSFVIKSDCDKPACCYVCAIIIMTNYLVRATPRRYQSVDPALVVKRIHSPIQRGNFPPIGKRLKPENVKHILAGTQPVVVKDA